ncbi:carbon storage regulator, partial [Vibrio parahaemolyticus]|nr:carbon storage regulator [Vibrio parahaemolyticus]
SSDNVASNTVSGNNILSSGAFADSSGISNVIQNSGNNVLIQNSTVDNLTLK